MKTSTTRSFDKSPHSPFSLVSAICAALLLAACGGGGGSTAAPAAATPQASSGSPMLTGTVTGFGSVIVDGVRVDNHGIAAGIDQEDGSTKHVEIKIGQHVEVQHDGNFKANAIKIRAQVHGPVEKVDTAAGSLVVLGQTVTINTDPALGPVTVFNQPYTQLADIKVGDSIEAHGIRKTDAAGKTVIQATRIEKTGAPPFKRVHGKIAELSTTSKTFKLGDLLVGYANAKVLPTNATLANDAEVVVSIANDAATVDGAIGASFVMVIDRKSDSKDKEAHIGGAATKIDAATKTFFVDSVKVDASQASFEPSGKSFADLKDGGYVRVKGTFKPDGSLQAKMVVLRGAEKEKGNEVEVHGTILSFVSMADFKVRDLAIDASSAKIKCDGATTLANNMQVKIEGQLSATGTVIAKTVICEKAEDGKSTVERKGVVSNVDTTARTMTIGTGSDAVKVQWGATTLFVSVEPSSLNGKLVKVEGTMSSDVLMAVKIKQVD